MHHNRTGERSAIRRVGGTTAAVLALVTASDPTPTHQLSVAGARVDSASSEGFAGFERFAADFAKRKPFVEPDRDDYELWEAGKLVPWFITQLLDAGKHVGPQVDIACKAEEPAVDMWEVGRLYPSWEQAVALARFLNVRVRDLGHPDARPCHEPRPSFRLRCVAVMSFDPAAVEAATASSAT